jgi:hypothetical protein
LSIICLHLTGILISLQAPPSINFVFLDSCLSPGSFSLYKCVTNQPRTQRLKQSPSIVSPWFSWFLGSNECPSVPSRTHEGDPPHISLPPGIQARPVPSTSALMGPADGAPPSGSPCRTTVILCIWQVLLAN